MDQLKALKEIYSKAFISPMFRANGAFANEVGDDLPYISLDDVLEIRLLPEGSASAFPYTEKGSLLKEYPSLEALVLDGWELD